MHASNGYPEITPWILRLFGKPRFRYPVYYYNADYSIYIHHWEYVNV